MEKFRGNSGTPVVLFITLSVLASAVGANLRAWADPQTSVSLPPITPQTSYIRLTEQEKELFWRRRIHARRLSQAWAVPLGQLGASERSHLLEQLLQKGNHPHDRLEELEAAVECFYLHRAPLREVSPLLQKWIFSENTPLLTRWAAAMVWTAHGGPAFTGREHQEWMQVLRQGTTYLASEIRQLPRSAAALEALGQRLPLSVGAIWTLDDGWLQHVPLTGIPGLSWNERHALHKIARFAKQLQRYRRWKAHLAAELTPHPQSCARTLLTDTRPGDTEIENNPLNRR